MTHLTEILGVKESFELTDKLMSALADPAARVSLFERYLATAPDLSCDHFLDEFQQSAAASKTLNQDFSPPAIGQLVAEITGSAQHVADICAGTGSLSVAQWAKNSNVRIEAEEFSRAAVAVLLFNYGVRNARAIVKHTDCLTGEVFAAWQLTPGDRFSDMVALDHQRIDAPQADVVVSNPPYSATWNPVHDARFAGFGLPPKSKADFAFILHGLSKLDDNGTLVAVLPHGVLFRGQSEGAIRKKLIESNWLDAVIGLPDSLFLHTDIPTCLLVFKKNRPDKDVLFIDASDLCVKDRAKKRILPAHIAEIATAYRLRRGIEKLASVVTVAEIERNDFNLNIPRYVDKFEHEPPVPLNETVDELMRIQQEIRKTNHALLDSMRLLASADGVDAEFKTTIEKFAQYVALADEPIHLHSGQGGAATAADIDALSSTINLTEQEIEQFKNMKQYFLENMFV